MPGKNAFYFEHHMIFYLLPFIEILSANANRKSKQTKIHVVCIKMFMANNYKQKTFKVNNSHGIKNS